MMSIQYTCPTCFATKKTCNHTLVVGDANVSVLMCVCACVCVSAVRGAN